jgi:salicylate hydroxylase
MADLPIIIAGAGPCGLVAALTLKRQGVPFVIIERATRSKLCANVGSGYDLAPTAIDILTNRLKLEKMNEVYAGFAGLRVQTMQGKDIRELHIAEMAKKVKFLNKDDDKGGAKFGTINRADLQNMLLDEIFPTSESEKMILRCGAGVQSYQVLKQGDSTDNKEKTTVSVTLTDGSTVEGHVLLACDGIHSAVRKQLHQDRKDELHFCNITCYWGKCEIPKGSKFEREVLDVTKKGKFGIMLAGSGKHPGSFMAIQCNNHLVWALLFKAEKPPGERSGDLTRRGGKVLDETSKAKLLDRVEGRGTLLRACLEATQAAGITEAGLFDRYNNTLPFTDGKCVILMGDSAHPQSPFMGQGCNMAVVDAYVVATRLAKEQSISEVLKKYDTSQRKASVEKVIVQARTFGNLSVSTSSLTCWVMNTVIKYLPSSWLFADLMSGDQSNSDFVAALDEDFPELTVH